jgi:hypothetical protein
MTVNKMWLLQLFGGLTDAGRDSGYSRVLGAAAPPLVTAAHGEKKIEDPLISGGPPHGVGV